MDEAPAKKRLGRPPKALDLLRRHQQSFRIRDVHRKWLQEAATKNERSLSEEVEWRIERSFDDVLIGDDIASIISVVKGTLLANKAMSKLKPWTESQERADEDFKDILNALSVLMKPTKSKHEAEFGNDQQSDDINQKNA